MNPIPISLFERLYERQTLILKKLKITDPYAPPDEKRPPNEKPPSVDFPPGFTSTSCISFGNNPPYKLVSFRSNDNQYRLMTPSWRWTSFCGPTGHMPTLFYESPSAEWINAKRRSGTYYKFAELEWFPPTYRARTADSASQTVKIIPPDFLFPGIPCDSENPLLIQGTPASKRGRNLLKLPLCRLNVTPLKPTSPQEEDLYRWIQAACTLIEGFPNMRFVEMLRFMWNENMYRDVLTGKAVLWTPRRIARLTVYGLKHVKPYHIAYHDHLTLKKLWRNSL